MRDIMVVSLDIIKVVADNKSKKEQSKFLLTFILRYIS